MRFDRHQVRKIPRRKGKFSKLECELRQKKMQHKQQQSWRRCMIKCVQNSRFFVESVRILVLDTSDEERVSGLK
jgi:hypothetical protein